MVEDKDAAGTKRVEQQTLDLRVVDTLDLLGIIEIANCSRRLDQGEAVTVERELRFATPRVFDRDLVRIVDAVPPRAPPHPRTPPIFVSNILSLQM